MDSGSGMASGSADVSSRAASAFRFALRKVDRLKDPDDDWAVPGSNAEPDRGMDAADAAFSSSAGFARPFGCDRASAFMVSTPGPVEFSIRRVVGNGAVTGT